MIIIWMNQALTRISHETSAALAAKKRLRRTLPQRELHYSSPVPEADLVYKLG